MICQVYQSNLLCTNFACILLHNYSIKLLSNTNQYIHFLKIEKKSQDYGAQISETGVSVNHTFNVLEEFSMCQILTSISTYYLIL